MVGRWRSRDVGPVVSVATATTRFGIRRSTTADPLSATLRGRRYHFAGACSHWRSNLTSDPCDQQKHDRPAGVRSKSKHGSPGSNHAIDCRGPRRGRLEQRTIFSWS